MPDQPTLPHPDDSSQSEPRLHGKVAVVTGGANGIGRACCVRFAEEGANVVVADLDAAQGAETVALVQAVGQEVHFVPTDTTREIDCIAMVQAAVDHFGGVDVCVAAAGISWGGYVSGQSPSRFTDRPVTAFNVAEQPLEHWDKVLNVNLTGVMLTDRAVARRMIEQGRGGSIINIASIDAKRPRRGSSAYAVSKAGVWMLTKTAALELARDDIRVNAIGPGYIETNMTEFMQDEVRRPKLLAEVPMRRLGNPREIANAALFLASDEASYFTGEILHPDGGYYTE
jgi:NAD(P)-dependent dehydrogenase (short-subunit alcohol dehydrogenase family)